LDTETVDRVGNVIDSLENSVGINILIGTSGYSVSVTGLCLGSWTSSITERELTKFILGMELVGDGSCWDC